MDLQLSLYFKSETDLSCSSDLLNEAFIELSDEESYQQSKPFITEPVSTPKSYSKASKCAGEDKNRRKMSTEVDEKRKLRKPIKVTRESKEVFEKKSPKKCSFPLNFEAQPRSKRSIPNPLLEKKKTSLARYSDSDKEFSPLEDISNKKLQPSDKGMLTCASRLGEIKIRNNSKRNFPTISNFNKNDKKCDTSIIVKDDETEIPKSSDCKKQGKSVYPSKNIPILHRKTGNRLPLLKSKETNLIELQSSNPVNRKMENKARFGLGHPTPNSKCTIQRRSLQNEKKLREDEKIAEEKQKKSSIMLRGSIKKVDLKEEIEFSEKGKQNKLVLSEFQTPPALPVEEIPVKKLCDIFPDSQQERIEALLVEPGILEVTDLTLYTSTVYFSRTFENKFTTP